MKGKFLKFVTATIHITKDFFLLEQTPYNNGVVNPNTSRNLSVVSCRKLGKATPIVYFNNLL